MDIELKTRSEYVGDGLWQWSAWLDPVLSLAAVEEVIFTLHSSFPRPVRRCRDRNSRFRIEDTTSSPFTIYASVLIGDGSKILLDSYIKVSLPPEAGEQIEQRPPNDMKPAILAVDDDPDVLHSVERDLRRRYADRYVILAARSGLSALSLLRAVQQRGKNVALIISDIRMPEMDGVEFLNHALLLYPRAKRVLLTAFADTDAAIRSINTLHLDHYILKPWDPPQDILYPVLDDLLEDWFPQQSDFAPTHPHPYPHNRHRPSDEDETQQFLTGETQQVLNGRDD